MKIDLSEQLRITEIFVSLQGEGRFTGLPTAFVRLTGCPLRCQYCDSEYAFYGGEKLSLAHILEQLRDMNIHYVCVTGGEPLAQPGCIALLEQLCDLGYHVSLETSGALSIARVDPRVSVVLDLKTPASGELDKNDYSNIVLLKPHHQLKFVICDRADYQWARFKVSEFDLTNKVDSIYFSPSYGQLAPEELAAWVIEDRLAVRFQIQLHKSLWGDKPGT